MNRCAPHLTRLNGFHRMSRFSAALLLAASAVFASPVALAQTDDAPTARKFPAAVLRGEMVVLVPPEIAMDGKPARLSPGARIRDANDQLVLSGPLVNQPVLVNYLRDNTGQVHQVWILTQAEARVGQRGFFDMLFNWNSGTPAAQPDDGKTPYEQLPAYKP